MSANFEHFVSLSAPPFSKYALPESNDDHDGRLASSGDDSRPIGRPATAAANYHRPPAGAQGLAGREKLQAGVALRRELQTVLPRIQPIAGEVPGELIRKRRGHNVL
eukprot:5300362-Prymnesium_polylepis.1